MSPWGGGVERQKAGFEAGGDINNVLKGQESRKGLGSEPEVEEQSWEIRALVA